MARTPNTHKKLEAAEKRSRDALSLFEQAANELELAAEAAEHAADEADGQRRHYETLEQIGRERATKSRTAAANLRSLLEV